MEYRCSRCGNTEYGTVQNQGGVFVICKKCGYVDELIPRNKQHQSTQQQNVPHCPKCGSTAITAGQRGFSIITGFLGSNKTVCRCANCGYSWKPGK